MKTMSCRQLGGACDTKFRADTFSEISEMSKKHGMEMYQNGDKEHIEAMEKMQELMSSPEIMKEWFENKRKSSKNYLKMINLNYTLLIAIIKSYYALSF
ncbi:MAG: hypothetical protein U5K00_09485 [Melioribacteraceae bacterium]|nr:hypothetical protein [Melioribacteraceae bacterium]